MTGSQAHQPIEGRLADRLSALRSGAGTARMRAVTLLRRLDSYDRAGYRTVAQLRIPLLDEPLKLPKGTKIRAVAHYDNSTANKANPDPKVNVKWGDQTWEEMMFTSLVFSIDGVAPGTVIATPPSGGGSR